MWTATERPTALVLASGQGLGFAAARALRQKGAQVITHALSPPSAAAAGAGVDALAHRAWDLAEPGATTSGVREILAAGHKPTILVYNCGGPPLGNFESVTPEQWSAGVQSILLSLIEAVRELRSGMTLAAWGRIVVISSIAAKEPISHLVISSVLRSGLGALIKCMAAELAAEKITVNAVLPGYFDTRRLDAFGDALDDIRATIPVGRIGAPPELAALIAFLASDEAAYITGQSITCDGGHLKGLR